MTSPSASEARHVEALARLFLQGQFVATLGLIRENRAYLDRIVRALMERAELFAEDFVAL